jgi:hypothetical protein
MIDIYPIIEKAIRDEAIFATISTKELNAISLMELYLNLL